MKRFMYRRRFIFIPLAVAAFLSVISFVVMQLWNHLLPDILHVATITYWQAAGLFILCKILFGFGKGGRGFGGGGGGHWMRARMEERLKHMSPEEREKFKAQMADRMCNWRDRGGRGRGRFGHGWDNFENEEGKTNSETGSASAQ